MVGLQYYSVIKSPATWRTIYNEFCKSDVEPEVHDISILHHVFFAFHAQLSGFAYGGLAAILDEVFVLDNFGTDESFFKVGMDNSGALRSFPAFLVGLCSHFHFSGGDEGFQIQQLVGRFNQAAYAGFF